MPKVNGKIYYNNVTGDVLVIVNQNEGVWIRETTFAQDVATYPQLKELDKNVISVLKLAWDQYKEDFMTQQAVKVVAGEIKWQPIGVNPPPPQDKPFSERLKEVESEREVMTARVTDLEDLILFITGM
ncbi:hypothetical protein [Exiguobacterium sp. S22-S28]|uniref:hypothetical protein n=1 Tax=Exiguobacterium sp. S22-S28 TaxID=3342768 RepID=UPI00372D4839